jgi:hypothetical protein
MIEVMTSTFVVMTICDKKLTLYFKQTIYFNMHRIAKRFDEPERWIEAVKKFRHPFWDYYRPRKAELKKSELKFPYPGVQNSAIGVTSVDWLFSVPEVLTVPLVKVLRPKCEDWEEIDNPLYSYAFKEDSLTREQWNQFNENVKARSATVSISISIWRLKDFLINISRSQTKPFGYPVKNKQHDIHSRTIIPRVWL